MASFLDDRGFEGFFDEKMTEEKTMVVSFALEELFGGIKIIFSADKPVINSFFSVHFNIIF